MRVRSLRTVGWRNLAEAEVVFPEDARLNVLHGDNAQGKTNVLEAIYFLAAFRSFRTAQVADLLAHGSSRTTLSVKVATPELERSVGVELQRSVAGGRALVSRVIRVDGKVTPGTARAFGLVSTVLFVPEDLSLLRAAPAARRRFLDMAVAAMDRAYFAEAGEFQKVLRNRNALLKAGEARRSSAGLLDTYDEQLAKSGARVVARRRRVVAALEPHVRRLFSVLHGELDIAMGYRSEPRVQDAVGGPEIAASILAGLVERRPIDLRRGHTTFGPHLDDLEIRLGGRLAREHASQGQLRSLVLALKLAELANVQAATSEAPVLLLDDVPSELDPSRRRYLFDTLASLDCQTFLTVADPAVVPTTARRADFSVRAGRLERVLA